jgi:hypothetical protein
MEFVQVLGYAKGYSDLLFEARRGMLAADHD